MAKTNCGIPPRVFSVEPLESRAMLAPMADFQLMDVNDTSSTFDQPVSPRDYTGQISGWYFGHST